MARGTWQGSGTWQTASSGGGLAAAVIAVIVLGSGAATAVASALAGILIAVAAVLVLAVAAMLFLLVRASRRRESAAVAQLQAAREARETAHTARIPVASAQPQALEQHVHYHVHLADSPDAARVISAIPGQAGEAIERN